MSIVVISCKTCIHSSSIIRTCMTEKMLTVMLSKQTNNSYCFHASLYMFMSGFIYKLMDVTDHE